MKVRTIEENVQAIYYKMTKQAWIAAICTILSGYLAHMFILTNELFNHDDIGALYCKPGLLTSRWLQSVFGHLVSPIGSGVMSGSFTIIILAVSALLLVDTLQIKSKALAGIVGIMFVVSPIVASFLSYVNASYRFAIGIPFAILAGRWFDRGFKGFWGACFSIMIAIAGYQSNVAITIAVMYIIMFIRLMQEDVNLKKWWKSFGKAALCLMIGLILYVLSNHVTVAILGHDVVSGKTEGYQLGVTGNDLTAHGYEGQAETGTLYLKEIPQTIATSVKYFVKYHFNIFFGGANVSFASKINTFSNILILLVVMYSVFWGFLKKRGIVQKVMLLAVFCVAPICMNATEILLNGKCTESLQMMYSMVMVVPFVIAIIDQNEKINIPLKNLCANLVFVAFILHIYGNMQIVNDAYLRMNSIYETAYGEMNRIMDRVEQLPEWQAGNRKLVFDFGEEGGYLINENYQAFTCVDDYIDMGWMGVFGTGVYSFWGNGNAGNIVKCYLGVEFETPSEEEIENLKLSKEYEELEMFPSMDAIKVINDIIVVRLDE